MSFYLMLSALTDDDRQFVEEIYIKYGDYMYCTAFKILGNRQDAEDAVNDAMCNMIKCLSEIDLSADSDICNLITISIRSIIRNKAIDHYRKNKKHMSAYSDIYVMDDESGEYVIREAEDRNSSAEEIVVKKEELEILKESLHGLSAEMREAVNLVYFAGYSCAEAADILGISTGALRARLFNARSNIKKALVKELCANE